MAKAPLIPLETVHLVRDTCLCLHTQRAARAVARRFDTAFKPVGLTNGQFSLLISLNRPEPPLIGEVAALLAMDRTTLTAALKTLERRDLVRTATDAHDRRAKRLLITAAGRDLLRKALPIWTSEHASIAAELPALDSEVLRRQLDALAGRGSPSPAD